MHARNLIVVSCCRLITMLSTLVVIFTLLKFVCLYARSLGTFVYFARCFSDTR